MGFPEFRGAEDKSLIYISSNFGEDGSEMAEGISPASLLGGNHKVPPSP